MSLQKKLISILKEYIGKPLYVVDKNGFEIDGNPHKLHDLGDNIILGNCFNHNTQNLLPDILAGVLTIRMSPPFVECSYEVEEITEVVK